MDLQTQQTIGDYVQLIMAVIAVIFVPYAIYRAWRPVVAQKLRLAAHWAWAGLCRTFVRDEAGAPLEISPTEAWQAIIGAFTVDVMSSETDGADTAGPGDPHDQQSAPEPLHPIANGNNAVNGEVTVNPIDAGGNSEAREVIRFQAKAEALAALIRAGKISNQAEAIEVIFECSRTSSKRPDTPYQRARRLIEHLVTPQPAQPVFYDDLRARIEAEVQAEMLEK